MTEYFLIYDDSCSICRRSVELVHKLDKKGLITLVELSRPKLPDHLSLPPYEAISEQIHLFNIEGKLWLGSDAITHLALMHGSSRVLGRILELPGITQLARWFYRVVAGNRHSRHRPDN